MATVTKPMALDETLQGTNNTISTQNSKLDTMNTKLQAIVDAIGSSSLIGDTDISGIADGTITGAIAGLDSGKVDKTSLGANNGVAQLDATGKVPSSQLPSFVDDVLEYASASAFPTTGESGKIYVALDTNLTYRWGGSAYVEISPSLALGETSSTAYRGDRGKIAYDHSQDANRVTTATAVGLYKVGATSEGHISGLTPIQKSDLTGVGLVGSVTDSTTNGNIVVDGVEIQAYDDTDVQNDIDAIEDELSTDYATVEGNPLNFSTLSAQNAKSTILSVEPIQDLHGYDKPWVGGAGKNKFDGTFLQGYWSGADGSFYTSGLWIATNKIPCEGDTNYVYSSDAYTTRWQSFLWYDGNGDYISQSDINQLRLVGYTAKSPANARYVAIDIAGPTDQTAIRPSDITHFQLEKGSQATTYEPYENICPISGRSEIGILGCGKNLADPNKYIDNRYMNFNGGLAVNNNYWVSGYQKVKPSTQYVVSPLMNGPFVNAYKADKTLISSISASNGVFTTTAETEYVIWCYEKTNLPYSSNIQLELGSTATSYEPYQESTDLTIDLGQTVYGAKLDVENGGLVVTDGFETFDGSIDENWTWESSGSRANILLNNAITGESARKECLSNEGYFSGANKVGVVFIWGATGLLYYYPPATSLADFKTWLASNPLQVCYELATPITINLTPHTINLLKGVNNISTDGDKITLTYRDGKVATLGDLTSAVDNFDSKIDDSKILTDTATGDKYILVVTNGVLDIQQVSN